MSTVLLASCAETAYHRNRTPVKRGRRRRRPGGEGERTSWRRESARDRRQYRRAQSLVCPRGSRPKMGQDPVGGGQRGGTLTHRLGVSFGGFRESFQSVHYGAIEREDEHVFESRSSLVPTRRTFPRFEVLWVPFGERIRPSSAPQGLLQGLLQGLRKSSSRGGTFLSRS